MLITGIVKRPIPTVREMRDHWRRIARLSMPRMSITGFVPRKVRPFVTYAEAGKPQFRMVFDSIATYGVKNEK